MFFAICSCSPIYDLLLKLHNDKNAIALYMLYDKNAIAIYMIYDKNAIACINFGAYKSSGRLKNPFIFTDYIQINLFSLTICIRFS